MFVGSKVSISRYSFRYRLRPILKTESQGVVGVTLYFRLGRFTKLKTGGDTWSSVKILRRVRVNLNLSFSKILRTMTISLCLGCTYANVHWMEFLIEISGFFEKFHEKSTRSFLFRWKERLYKRLSLVTGFLLLKKPWNFKIYMKFFVHDHTHDSYMSFGSQFPISVLVPSNDTKNTSETS